MVQKAVRQVFKESHLKATSEQKQQVLNQLEGKSFEESQVIVARSFDIEIQMAPKVQHQGNESIRLEISFSKDQWAKMEQMRTLLSHSLPSGSWEEVFEYVADKVIRQKARSSIPASIARQVFQRDQCCQFVDRATGRQCASKWQLQIDHIKPVWTNGDNSLSNLWLLCSCHNQARYRKQAGIRPV